MKNKKHSEPSGIRRQNNQGIRLLKSSACALGVGVIFGLGMSAQKAWSSGYVEDSSWRVASPKEDAEARTAAYERVRENVKLSFYEELRKAESRIPSVPAAQPDKVAMQMPAAPKGATKQVNRVDPTGGTAQTNAAKQSVLDKAETKKEGVGARNSNASDIQDQAANEIGFQDRSVSRQANMAAALARVLGDDAPSWVQPKSEDVSHQSASSNEAPLHLEGGEESIQKAPQQKDAQPNGRFVVQVGSFPTADGAQRVLQKLRSRGYNARIEKANLVGRGLVHRVQIPGYETHAAASTVKGQLSDTMGLGGFVLRE